MSRTRSAKCITEYLTSPGRVAHSLDWRKCSGNILSLRISKNQIELAIASHPSYQEPVVKLTSIPLEERTVAKNKKVLDERVGAELASVIRDYHVCGMVVGWPVRPEGYCGAQCGRVLRVLDQLTVPESGKSTTIFHESRPVCLYDPEHNLPTEDGFGRSAIHSRLPAPGKKRLHLASEEQYKEPNDEQAVLKIWNDFCKVHWPDLVNQPKRSEAQQDWADNDHLEDDAAYEYESDSRLELAYSF